jgi:hypothetical protein
MNLTELDVQDSLVDDANSAAGTDWGLEVSTGPPEGECRPLAGVFRIGRSAANDLEIPDQRVSRFHAFIRQLGSDHFEIVDLGSTNGTQVNGWRINSPVRLNPGDVAVIGLTQMTIHGPDPAVSQDALDEQGSVLQPLARWLFNGRQRAQTP